MASYFAILGALNVVSSVIVIEPDVAARGQHGDQSRMLQTYVDGSKNGRYAGRGMTFDPLAGSFTTTAMSGALSTPIPPSDNALEFSDSPPPTEKTLARYSVTRAINDAVGFKFCSPNVRLRFRTNATTVEMGFRFTKKTTHGAYNSTAEIFVDGVSNSTFNAPDDSSATAPPGPIAITLSFGSATTRLVEVLWPTGDSMDFLYLRTNGGASVLPAAPPRPSGKICLIGDSITQGLSMATPSQTWAYKLGELKGRQIVNLGYGGRTAIASDGSAVAGTGCADVFYMIGTNDFLAQIAPATFQASALAALQNIRAALPNARIYASGPMYMNYSPTIPASSYRTAMSNAVASFADAKTTYVNGLSLMTNSPTRLSDEVHPNAAGSAEIATNLAVVIQ